MMLITHVWHDDVPEQDASPQDACVREQQGSEANSSDQSAGELPTVSVVLVSYTGEAELARTLGALAAQSYPTHLMDIIVACPAQVENASRIVASAARQRPGLRLRCVAVPTKSGTSTARNCGWRHARGAIVAFTTDAVVPSPHWIEGAIEAFDSSVDIVGGSVVVPVPRRPNEPLRRAVARLQEPWSAHNIFYRRSVLRRLGGFDEAYSGPGYDATDLVLAAVEAGAHCCAAERAVVVYDRPQATWLQEMRRQMLQVDDARLAHRYPSLYTQFVRRAPPLFEYAAVAALCGLVSGALMRRRALTLVGAAGWATITLLLMRRPARNVWDRPRELARLALGSAALPPVTVALRLYGAMKHRVWRV